MSRSFLLVSFKEEKDLLQMIKDVRKKNYQISDVFTPYPVHRIEEVMGLPQSKLPWVSLSIGFLACAGALLFQSWVATVDWPINIGGKPFLAWQIFIPIAFEFTVLCAGVGTVLALLYSQKLFPGQRPAINKTGATHDLFVLCLLKTNTIFDENEIQTLCLHHHAVDIRDHIEDET